MSRPFVLHWFPSDNSGNYYKPEFDPEAEREVGFDIMAHFVESSIGVAATVLRKRLSLSDLAAEYWREHGWFMGMVREPWHSNEELREAEVRLLTLTRFATTPHHDSAHRPELEWREGEPYPRVEQVQP